VNVLVHVAFQMCQGIQHGAIGVTGPIGRKRDVPTMFTAVEPTHERMTTAAGSLVASSVACKSWQTHMAHDLAQIEYARCAVVSLDYRRDQIRHPLDGFSLVVPLVERRTIL
jgi:hypothetical protein